MELQCIDNLKQHFDCVVMLTCSDWKTEPGSNRYRYATRFAQHLPVFFVQPDGGKNQYRFEPTEITNIAILHVPKTYDAVQSTLLAQALNEKRCISPLLWCYTPRYSDFIESCYSPLKVYHATEDHFSPDYSSPPGYDLPALLRRTLDYIDLVVAVSDDVAQSYVRRGGYGGNILTLANGCDHPSLDNDVGFSQLVDCISASLERHKPGSDTLNILFLYDASSTYTMTVHEFLDSFRRFSRHNIYYAHAVGSAKCNYDFSLFDAVVIHYSVRLALPNHISPSIEKKLRQYAGLKILYIQDEYDATERTRQRIEALGLHVVFTCVPPKYIHTVYPKDRFPKVQFAQVLTGYVPIFELPVDHIKPTETRPVLIGYRGRPLAYWYGKLAQEKMFIGKRMRELCDQRGLVTDIEWTEEKRIYGDGWYQFLANCKATLGTESGANVFDDHGTLRASVARELKNNPDTSFEEIFDEYLSKHEGKVMMNQVSPKIFEAIILRTALVLFEGEYSGVVIPDRHFIPLKKDFSNVDEVLDKLHDNNLLSRMTETAYREVIQSGKYSYNSFVQNFDRMVSSKVRKSRGLRFLAAIIGAHVGGVLVVNRLATIAAGANQLTASAVGYQDMAVVFPRRLSSSARVNRLLAWFSLSAVRRGVFRALYSRWAKMPSGVRDFFRPVTQRIARFLLNQ